MMLLEALAAEEILDLGTGVAEDPPSSNFFLYYNIASPWILNQHSRVRNNSYCEFTLRYLFGSSLPSTKPTQALHTL